jgi:hypothetical protein
MKSLQWKTYRTRFLVKARKLTSSLSFTDPLGREHRGRKGDYLVESFDGVVSIAPRHIFEDIYVAMCAEELAGVKVPKAGPLQIETLQLETIKSTRSPIYFEDARPAQANEAPRTRRKSPQPVRSTSSRMSLM